MSQSFMTIFKKDETDSELGDAQVVDAAETAEGNQDNASKKGTHGEDFCCGSCS